MTEDLAENEVFVARWPEFVTDGDPMRGLQDFDFLSSIALRVHGDPALGHWKMYHEGATDLALRLRRDPSARADAAQAVGLLPDEFIEKAVAALAEVRGPNAGFDNNSPAAALLASGSAH